MSKIEWTHRPGTKSEVWNPTTGCDKVSQGCKNCYAEIMHKRLRGMGQKKYQHPFLGHLIMHEDELLKPLKWKKSRTVFVNSMSDLFHKDVNDIFLNKVFAVMMLTPQHTYQILTKRADRMAEYFEYKSRYWNIYQESVILDPFSEVQNKWPLENVWLGVSCEDQNTADERIPKLLQCPAPIRFISYEPALGPIDLLSTVSNHVFKNVILGDAEVSRGIQWVIAGGESGNNARPPHPDWFRKLRDQCKAASVPFFFKQWGKFQPDSHVSFNGPFFIHNCKHYLVNMDGETYPYGDHMTDHPKYTDKENTRANECNLTKEDNAYWMAKTNKSKSGNHLDGVQHLEFPE